MRRPINPGYNEILDNVGERAGIGRRVQADTGSTMTINRLFQVSLAGLTLLAMNQLKAQDQSEFSLFEEVQDNSAQQQQRVTRQQASTSGNQSGPEFVLVGTSRIGNRHRVMLKHRSGNTVNFAVEPSSQSTIPGYEDYLLVEYAPGKVSIRFPADTPCASFSDKGVDCLGDINIARLSLALGDVVTRSPGRNASTSSSSATTQEANATENANREEAERPNPFEVLRANQAAAQQGNGQPARIQVRRIAPEDVPEGYRVISTPFGDRLVEE